MKNISSNITNVYGTISNNSPVVNGNNSAYSGTVAFSNNTRLISSDKTRTNTQRNVVLNSSTVSTSILNNFLPSSMVVVQNSRIPSYHSEMSVGAALMRASASPSKLVTNTITSSLPNTNNNNSLVPVSLRSACPSPYPIIVPARGDSVILQNRESPSVTPNQGSTTPTNSQIHSSNSHSSPRPSILRKLNLIY